jgi:hypothetical protein
VKSRIRKSPPPFWQIKANRLIREMKFFDIRAISSYNDVEILFFYKVPIKSHLPAPRGNWRRAAKKKNPGFQCIEKPEIDFEMCLKLFSIFSFSQISFDLEITEGFSKKGSSITFSKREILFSRDLFEFGIY